MDGVEILFTKNGFIALTNIQVPQITHIISHYYQNLGLVNNMTTNNYDIILNNNEQLNFYNAVLPILYIGEGFVRSGVTRYLSNVNDYDVYGLSHLNFLQIKDSSNVLIGVDVENKLEDIVKYFCNSKILQKSINVVLDDYSNANNADGNYILINDQTTYENGNQLLDDTALDSDIVFYVNFSSNNTHIMYLNNAELFIVNTSLFTDTLTLDIILSLHIDYTASYANIINTQNNNILLANRQPFDPTFICKYIHVQTSNNDIQEVNGLYVKYEIQGNDNDVYLYDNQVSKYYLISIDNRATWYINGPYESDFFIEDNLDNVLNVPNDKTLFINTVNLTNMCELVGDIFENDDYSVLNDKVSELFSSFELLTYQNYNQIIDKLDEIIKLTDEILDNI